MRLVKVVETPIGIPAILFTFVIVQSRPNTDCLLLSAATEAKRQTSDHVKELHRPLSLADPSHLIPNKAPL